MPTVKEIARALLKTLEDDGNSIPLRYDSIHPSASSNQEFSDVDYRFEFDPFIGYSISAVVCDERENNKQIYLFVSGGRIPKNLSKEISGIKIVAAKLPPFRITPEKALGASAKGHFYKNREYIACGSSCSLVGSSDTGTLGAIVYDGQNHFILSNNHVIANCNHAEPGTPVYAPGTKDAAAKDNTLIHVGSFFNANVLYSGHPMICPKSLTDAAIASLNENVMCSWQGDQENGYDTPSQTIHPQSGMKVKKFGRTTGLTHGIIIGEMLDDTCRVAYKSAYFTGHAYFENAWFVSKLTGDNFAAEGDSGSLVVTEDHSHAVGLLFAANNGHGVIIPINNVLERLKELVTYGGAHDPNFTLASNFFGSQAEAQDELGTESDETTCE